VSKGSEYDVAVVGLGPVGATLANLLGIAGVRVCVIEREASMYPLPRAGHFDDEVMRVWQTAGLADQISKTVRVNPGMRFVDADGTTLVDWPRPQAIGHQGWHPSYRFHQPYVDAILRDGLSRFPSHTVHLGTEVTALRAGQDRVALTCVDRTTGDEREVSARFVVGCDGARSIVRRTMAADEEDLGASEKWIVVDLKLIRDRPDLGDETVQYCDPRRPTTYIRMVEDRRRWEFMLMPGETEDSVCRPEKIAELLRPWLHPDEAAVERAVVYTFQAVLANGWRRGPLLLAGDSCHRTPPFLGQGMCAGIRDAMNLAWKLAAVISGGASDSLLDSYETERRPHVRQYLDLAIRLGGILQNTDANASVERDTLLAQGPTKLVSITPTLGLSTLNRSAAPAGTLSHQLRLSCGRLMDDVVGYRFAVLGARDFLDSATPTTRAAWQKAGAAVLSNEGETYLAGLDAKAAIIRPDRYLFGVAKDSADLEEISDLLPSVSGTAVAA
jgi:3-(3-hydroxy-phenyl)propionate hydroxylase